MFTSVSSVFAKRIVYLISKNVNFILENPSTSLLWRYKPLREPWRIRNELTPCIVYMQKMQLMKDQIAPSVSFPSTTSDPSKKLLKKYNCISVNVTLGSYGALTPKLEPSLQYVLVLSSQPWLKKDCYEIIAIFLRLLYAVMPHGWRSFIDLWMPNRDGGFNVSNGFSNLKQLGDMKTLSLVLPNACRAELFSHSCHVV